MHLGAMELELQRILKFSYVVVRLFGNRPPGGAKKLNAKATVARDVR